MIKLFLSLFALCLSISLPAIKGPDPISEPMAERIARLEKEYGHLKYTSDPELILTANRVRFKLCLAYRDAGRTRDKLVLLDELARFPSPLVDLHAAQAAQIVLGKHEIPAPPQVSLFKAPTDAPIGALEVAKARSKNKSLANLERIMTLESLAQASFSVVTPLLKNRVKSVVTPPLKNRVKVEVSTVPYAWLIVDGLLASDSGATPDQREYAQNFAKYLRQRQQP